MELGISGDEGGGVESRTDQFDGLCKRLGITAMALTSMPVAEVYELVNGQPMPAAPHVAKVFAGYLAAYREWVYG